jgi:hypothetical protein
MDPATEEKHRQKIAEGARKQLAMGTWPQVMAVFAYPTPKAPRHSDEEVAPLKQALEEAGLKNMSLFFDLARLDEQRLGVPMSYNLSVNRRLAQGEVLNSENAWAFLLCPDVLVGTRWGLDASFEWFKNFIDAIPRLVPESLQVFDKVFGEANEHLKATGEQTTLAAIIEEVNTPSHEKKREEGPKNLPN